jgi:hypothetical protein
MALDVLDPMVQIFSEFRELGFHDATTPKLLSLQSPNLDMGIHVGDQRSSRIWIQQSTIFQSFPQTLTAHHASPPMDDLDPFRTPPFYHRAHRGFGYRDFVTCEDKGSFPLVSRVSKH